MPRERRSDRLAGDELEAMQRKALREWCESDWLATHAPRAYQAVEAQDPGEIRVDLGGGVGESEQEPGYIVVGAAGYLPDRTGERRQPDIFWNLGDGRLPFEDQTVDRYCLPARVLRHLPDPAYRALPKELARTLAVGGTLKVDGGSPGGFVRSLEDAGFARDEDGTFTLTAQTTPLEQEAPLMIDDRIMGLPRIPTVRQPS
jgi:hypothetical protein